MRRGFTLVELLAVIIILGVLSLITIPVISSEINKSRINAYRTSVQNIIDKAKEYSVKNMQDSDIPEDGLDIKVLKFKNKNIKSGLIKKNENDEIEAVNIYDGNYCASGTKNSIIIERVNNVEECNTIDFTAPVLKIKVVKVNNTSIMVNAYGTDSQSDIYKYQFKIGNEEFHDVTTNKNVASYEFTNLRSNTDYEITVRVSNINVTNNDPQYKNNLDTHTTEGVINAKTLAVGIPEFKVSSNGFSKSKEIEIIYPKIDGGVNYYKLLDSDSIYVDSNSIKIDVTKNGRLFAYVEYGSEIVENSINIYGIDDNGPQIMDIVNPDTWEKTKVVTFKVKDTGSGLASRPYSFDGGKTWIKGNDPDNKSIITRTYTSNQTVDFLVRDKMGNITPIESFLNGEKLHINKVDRTNPKCSLKVSSGTLGTNGWYKKGSIDDVTVEFNELIDQAEDEQGKLINTNGVVKADLSNTTSDSQTVLGSSKPRSLSSVIKYNGIYIVNAKVYDEAGNTSTCSIEVKRDIEEPVITGFKVNGSAYGSGYLSGSTVQAVCKDDVSGVASTPASTPMTTVGANSREVSCTDKAGNTVSKASGNYTIYIYTADASKCGMENYSCNPHSCNPYKCNGYSCNAHNCNPYQCNCVPVYGTQSYSYKCGTYKCNCKRLCEGNDPRQNYSHCHDMCSTCNRYCTGYRQVQTGTSCQTCYNTCYDTCYNTCYNTCYDTCRRAASCWHL